MFTLLALITYLLNIYCIFPDCQCFFLRHTQSGKCVASGTLFREGSLGKLYPPEMFNNCLNVSAQFRYRSGTELLHNIKTEGTLVSAYAYQRRRMKGIRRRRQMKRLFVYEGKNSSRKAFKNHGHNSLRQTPSGSLYLYKENSCVQPFGIYVDQKRGGCSDAVGQRFTFGAVTSYNTKMKDVHCSYKQVMNIKRADYGDFNKNGAFDYTTTIDAKCSMITNCQVKSRCSGKSSCELHVDDNLLLPEYCPNPDASKEIYIEYTCEDSPSIVTNTENIRLHNASEGYIEIKDGSSWKRVNDRNWDKNRQKMLCRHLGFQETDRNDISLRGSGKNRDIASGDLICYNTQSNGSSCCAGMERSTTGSTDIEIPYVTCKICDKPLLKDRNLFPDSVFSGVGGSRIYKKARLYDSGWCSLWRRRTAYVTIDLQREYHITQVVTMGVKDQRWWSGSYSLKYSHNKTLVDIGSVIQITGNKNGYQATTTTLDIFNVRYMKIESTGGAHLCLRIELCGKAQTPAPVVGIAVTSSNFSAMFSWTIPGPKTSSYITGYEIWLNSKLLSRVTRKKYGNMCGIIKLTPNRDYTFAIRALDDSFQHSTMVLKNFTTKNADPVNPVTISSSSLSLEIPKPPNYLKIKEVMVIVQIATSNPTPSEDIETSELKPYQKNTQDPYITAYLKADDLPLTFMIGDCRGYFSGKEKYFNTLLKHNTSYIVFLRFFESKDSYYSTEWSSSVKTMVEPQVKCAENDSETSELSSVDETRVDLIVPLVIVCLCLLLSFGVIVYLLHRKNKQGGRDTSRVSQRIHQNQQLDSIQGTADGYELVERFPDGRKRFYQNEDSHYAKPDEVLDHDARNNAGDEPSAYMSLQDNRQPDNFYQPLQHPAGRRADQGLMRGDQNTVKYQNPAFKAKLSRVIKGE